MNPRKVPLCGRRSVLKTDMGTSWCGVRLLRLPPLLALVLGGCSITEPQPAPRPEPIHQGCKAKPAKLPPIATGAQVKARHDQLDALYDDCAYRLRQNIEAM